jgi:hypothetical protein
VEVETDQAAGTYQLAGGAGNFTGTLALYVGNANGCGDLSLDTSLDYAGKQYTLLNSNGVLALKIA